MMKVHLAVLCIAVLAIGAGCQSGADSNSLVLPEGDAEQGKALFVELQCTSCHTVAGVSLPEPAEARQINFMLGGQRSKTYAELVTSIINPSHRIAGRFRGSLEQGEDSPMVVYNDVMTVTQLINLAAFLVSQYEMELPPRYRYVLYDYDKG